LAIPVPPDAADELLLIRSGAGLLALPEVKQVGRQPETPPANHDPDPAEG
jgi:hypothetical protein